MDMKTTTSPPYAPSIAGAYPPFDPRYVYEPTGSATYSGLATPPMTEPQSRPAAGGDIEELLRQKQGIVDSRIAMLVHEIYQRRELKEVNLYRIDLDQCAFRDLILLSGENWVDKGRIELEKQIINLEEAKRKEETGYFRDIQFIRKELRDTLIEKIEEHQKNQLFLDQEVT